MQRVLTRHSRSRFSRVINTYVFEIDAEASASLATEVDMQIGIKYSISQALFTLSQQDGGGGISSLNDTRTIISFPFDRHGEHFPII
jgi:hypothetical protein